MKKLALCLMPLFFVCLSGCGVDKEKLVGVWEVEDGPAGLPKGTTMEFTSDGKVKIGIGPISVEGGTYEVSGSIITIKPPSGKEGKGRIKELTDDKLVIKDDAEPKELVLRKKKGGNQPTEAGPKVGGPGGKQPDTKVEMKDFKMPELKDFGPKGGLKDANPKDLPK